MGKTLEKGQGLRIFIIIIIFLKVCVQACNNRELGLAAYKITALWINIYAVFIYTLLVNNRISNIERECKYQWH